MTLPITLTPGLQESLRSYLRRTLAANGIGLGERTRWFPEVSWPTVCVAPTQTELKVLSAATRQAPSSLLHASILGFRAAMPMLALLNPATSRDVRNLTRRVWLWPVHSQCCPQCMSRHPDIWLRDWQSPYVLGCPTHERLLLTRCRACSVILSDGHSHGFDPTCPRDNRQQLTPHDLRALGRIIAALSGSSVRCSIGPIGPSDYLDALRSLSALLSHLDHYSRVRGHGQARPLVAPPELASTRRALLVRADQLLRLTPYQAAAHLRLRIDQVRGSYGRRSCARDHSTPTPVTEPILRLALSGAVSLRWARIDSVPRTIAVAAARSTSTTSQGRVGP